ncbi:MAG: GNAT family N-acetyltransferase [Candidatus Hydrogenedentes bacterium]|nr:GNAT family N-acetyltransferase [Candidatus Hydrogenedentota bacterium]
MIVQAYLPIHKYEWLRLRCALWPTCTRAEHEAEQDWWLEQADVAVFVVKSDDGSLIGFAETSIHTEAPGCSTDRIGFLEGWYVEEAYRKRGIGRALNDAVEQWARERGCTEMASDTGPEYPDSHAAHLGIGYCEAGDPFNFFKRL